jgi:hypothetical protein
VPLNRLDFVSDFARYPADTPPPNYPGESTGHMRTSGDWVYTAAPVRNQAGTVTFNDVAYGPGQLGVANLDASGNPEATAVAWALSTDFALTWPAGGPGNFQIAAAGGVTDPPPGGNPPGTGSGIGVYLTRSGAFFTAGQTVSHSEGTGGGYTGGGLTVRVEVTRHGPWWVQVHGGATLLYTACGDVWGGGELYSGTFGVGDPFGSGAVPRAVLTTDAVAGATSVRAGPAECPHAPTPGGPRAWALWWP